MFRGSKGERVVDLLTRRWRSVFVVDVILKFLLLYGGAILASLGMIVMGGIEPAIYFVIFAAALAVLNVMCLMLGSRLVASFRCPLMMQYPALWTVAVAICATGMFGGILAALFGLGHGLAEGASVGLFLSVTNLVSIAIVLFLDGIFRLVSGRIGR